MVNDMEHLIRVMLECYITGAAIFILIVILFFLGISQDDLEEED